MKYLVSTCLFLCSSALYGQFLKKSPGAAVNLNEVYSNRIVMQRVDRENSTYIYDTYPIVFQNPEGGRGQIILQPFITLNAVTGFTEFHMWVSYRPPFGAAGTASFIYPKYLTILSARQKLTLPLFYYYQALPGTNLVSIPGAPSGSSESAYTVLSPEDLSTLLAIAYEGFNEGAIEAWEPTAFQTLLGRQAKRAAPKEPLPSKQSIQEYVESQKKQGEDENYRSLNWGLFIPPLPPMADQRAVSVVLTGEKAVMSIDAVQAELTPVLEMIDLYQALSNRTIAVP